MVDKALDLAKLNFMVKYSVGLLDKAFDALANKHRRDIISALALQPLSISTLAEWQGLSLPAIHPCQLLPNG